MMASKSGHVHGQLCAPLELQNTLRRSL